MRWINLQEYDRIIFEISDLYRIQPFRKMIILMATHIDNFQYNSVHASWIIVLCISMRFCCCTYQRVYWKTNLFVVRIQYCIYRTRGTSKCNLIVVLRTFYKMRVAVLDCTKIEGAEPSIKRNNTNITVCL